MASCDGCAAVLPVGGPRRQVGHRTAFLLTSKSRRYSGLAKQNAAHCRRIAWSQPGYYIWIIIEAEVTAPARNNAADTATRSCLNKPDIRAFTARSEDAQDFSVVSIDVTVISVL